MSVVTNEIIEDSVKSLLTKYNAEYAVLFGSYARGEASETSDIDIVVFGGEKFKKTSIFAFGEDLREMTSLDVDAFEISEIDPDSLIYENVMREGVRIA